MKEKIENSGLKEFTVKCLTNHWDEKTEIIKAYWDAADDLEAFKAAVFSDDRLKATQAYAELSKEDDGHWYRVREMFGGKCFKTFSDAGGIKVGCDAFSMTIGNGIGDGTTRVAVFTKDDAFNANMMRYSGISVNGKFSVYDYDCGDTPIIELNGNFFVYTYDGLVAFAESV